MKVTTLLLFVIGSLGFTAHAEDPLVVIVNASNTVGPINLTEVRIYWMRRPKKRWEKIDKTIKPVDRKDKCDSKNQFYDKILKLTETAVESYFTARQYQNGELPPSRFNNDHEIVDYIANEAGAIGYVRKSSLSVEALSKVRIIYTLE